MENDEVLTDLYNRLLINEQKARYCHLLDSRRFEELVETCFAKHETVVDFTPEHHLVEGFEAVHEFYTAYVPSIRDQTAHRVSNGVMVVEGNVARATWYMHGSLVVAGEPYWVQGVYDDEFVLEDGSWKIRVLNLRWEYLCHYRDGWVDPVERPGIAWSTKNPGAVVSDART